MNMIEDAWDWVCWLWSKIEGPLEIVAFFLVFGGLYALGGL